MFDLICMGRSTLDLFANELGVPFRDIRSFAAFVGGCPNNICVMAHRLGLKATIITGVGGDLSADFVRTFLQREGIDTSCVFSKPGFQTNTVLVAIQPPDDFQFVPYHASNADLELTIDDVAKAPLAATRAFLFSGMCLLQDPSRSATQFAAERARQNGALVCMDADYREAMWPDARIYGITARVTLPLVDVLIGTEEELAAAAGQALLADALVVLLDNVQQAVVVKRGKRGSSVYSKTGSVVHTDPYLVQVVNPLGAGDAFAGGFIYGMLQGWDWAPCARFANACGAFIVTKHGCANDMPTLAQVQALMQS